MLCRWRLEPLQLNVVGKRVGRPLRDAPGGQRGQRGRHGLSLGAARSDWSACDDTVKSAGDGLIERVEQ